MTEKEDGKLLKVKSEFFTNFGLDHTIGIWLWVEGLLSKQKEEIKKRFQEDVDVIDKNYFDCKTDLIKEHKREMKETIDKIWEDDELQDAICKYGEWNGMELNKAFKKVKEKYNLV